MDCKEKIEDKGVMIMNVEERLEEIQAIESKLYPGYSASVEFQKVIATLMVAEQLESIANILKNKRGI